MNDINTVRDAIENWCVTQSGDAVSEAFERIVVQLASLRSTVVPTTRDEKISNPSVYEKIVPATHVICELEILKDLMWQLQGHPIKHPQQSETRRKAQAIIKVSQEANDE